MEGKPLTALQWQTIHALMTERTVIKAARKVGVARATIYNWNRKNPKFQAALIEAVEKVREELWRDISTRYGSPSGRR